jgi:hypothetical protein
MSQRSVEVYFKYQESAEKLDYFVCGVAGALFAYAGQNFAPRKLDSVISLLEPLALCFLVAAFFTGIKRIEASINLKKLNHIMLDAGEKAGAAAGAAADARKTGGTSYYNEHGGEVFGVETIAKKHEWQRGLHDAAEAEIEVAIRKANTFYTLRNCLLIAGFVALLAAKLLQPYSSQASNVVKNAPSSGLTTK